MSLCTVDGFKKHFSIMLSFFMFLLHFSSLFSSFSSVAFHYFAFAATESLCIIMCESESESHECNNGKMGISIKFVELFFIHFAFFLLTQFYNQQFLFSIVLLLLLLHYTEHSSFLCFLFLAILSAIILDTISSMSMYNLPFFIRSV